LVVSYTSLGWPVLPQFSSEENFYDKVQVFYWPDDLPGMQPTVPLNESVKTALYTVASASKALQSNDHVSFCQPPTTKSPNHPLSSFSTGLRTSSASPLPSSNKDIHPFNGLFQDNVGKLAPERLNQSGF